MAVHFKLYAQSETTAIYEQGIEAFNKGNYKSSEMLLRKIVELNNENRETAFYYLALSVYEQGRYEAAIFEFNRYLLIGTNSKFRSESRFWIAEATYKKGEVLASIEEYKRFLSESTAADPDYVTKSYNRIGDVYYKQDRFDESIIEWEKAYLSEKDQSKKLAIKYRIATALFKNKKNDRAVSLLNEIISNDTNSNFAYISYVLIARIYCKEEKYSQAGEYLDKIPQPKLTVFPISEALYFQSIVYRMANRQDEAELKLRTFLNFAKDSEFINLAKYDLGVMLLRKNNGEALSFLSDVFVSEKDVELKCKAGTELVNVYMSEGDVGKAEEILQKILVYDNYSDHKNSLIMMGEIYILQKRLDKAESLFLDLKKKYMYDENSDRIDFFLAVVYLKMGREDKFSEGMKNLYKNYPFSNYKIEIDYYIAVNEYEKGNNEKAEKLFYKYINNPKSTNIYESYICLINIYVKRNDLSNCDKIVQMLVKKYPKNAGMDFVLAQYIQLLNKNSKDSKKYKNILYENFPVSSHTATISKSDGNFYFSNGDYSNAAKDYGIYIKCRGKFEDVNVFYNYLISLYETGGYSYVINNVKYDEIKNYDKPVANKAMFILGKSYYASGFYDDAYSVYTTMMYNDMEKKEYLVLYKILLKLKDIEKAKIIMRNFSDSPELLSEALLYLGKYYVESRNIDMARSQFNAILLDYPGSYASDYSRIELAKICMDEKKTNEANSYLSEVRTSRLLNKRNAVLFKFFLATGNIDKSMEIINSFNKLEGGDSDISDALKTGLDLFSKNGNLLGLMKISELQKSYYKDEADFSDFYIANYYFNIKNYKNAYYYYFNIMNTMKPIRNEVLYNLGMISVYYYNNQKNAFFYFNKLSSSNNVTDKYVCKAKLNLSIINHEDRNDPLAEKLLRECINTQCDENCKVQVENLLEQYGQ